MISMHVLDIHSGDLVRLKKAHPCGGFEWQVEKVGYEVRAKCLTCGSQVSLVRSDFERRVKVLISGATVDKAKNP